MKKISALITVFLLIIFATTFVACGADQKAGEAKTYEDGLSVVYFADTQSTEAGDPEYKLFAELMAEADSLNPDMYVFGGDMIDDENSKDEWSFWDKAVNVTSAEIYTAAGNHTKDEGYIEHFELPQNGPENYKELFYTVGKGDALFIVMDSNTMGSSEDKTVNEISGWLEEVLEDSDAEFKAVVIHHPMYAVTAAPKDAARAENMRKYYLPLMEKGEVDIILCGHQHVYARDEENGIIQLMGNASPKGYSANNAELDFTAEGPVYTHISIKDSKAEFVTYDKDTNVVDSFIIE